MTAAMYASIAGLKAHMQKLSVIGNNVANVNTVGYKSQRALFKDSMYNMYSSGSDGTTTVAGKNPSQIGYGTIVSTIDIDMSTATPNFGKSTDLMIDGDGFFLVGDKDTANTIDPSDPSTFKNLSLSRVGDITPKADGYFSDSNNGCIYGFQVVGKDAEGKPIVSDQLVPLRLPQMERVVVSKDNPSVPLPDDELDNAFDDTTGDLRNDYMYTYVARYPVVAESGEGQPVISGTGTADDDTTLLDSDLTNIALQNYGDYINANKENPEDPDKEFSFATIEGLAISSTGAITATMKETGEQITIGYVAMGIVTNPNGVTHTGGYYYKAGEGAGDLQIALQGGIGKDLTVVGGGKMSYVNASMYIASQGENAEDVNLEDVLSAKSLVASTGGGTEFVPGYLEASNADLATEISELITTQRGYQANTRIVTVTDSMLEELVNMKR